MRPALCFDVAKMRAYHPVDLRKPQWTWSQRDWAVFKAYCRPTDHHLKLVRRIVPYFRSGMSVAKLAVRNGISRERVRQVLATEEWRDRIRMECFYARRRNNGRPIDMGGPRDVWIESDVIDEF